MHSTAAKEAKYMYMYMYTPGITICVMDSTDTLIPWGVIYNSLCGMKLDLHNCRVGV